MIVFAFLSLPAVRAGLQDLVQVTFTLYVLLSLFAVGTYAAKKIRTGRLIGGRAAPLPFSVPPAGEWLLVLDLAALPFMHAVLYSIVILTGLLVLFAMNKFTANDPAIMPRAGAWLFVLNVFVFLLMQSALYMVLIVAGVAVLLIESGRTAQRQFGLERLTTSQLVRWSLLISGAVIAAASPLTELITVALNAVHWAHPEQQSVVTFRQFTTPSQIFDFMIQAVVIAPLIEELFFRGFLLTFLKGYMSTWIALIFSAGIFAFAHLNLGIVLPLWLLGIVLGVAYEHTGSVLLPMGIHACFNFTTAVTLLLEKGNS
jgi:membrane protease YdiL (CAAX protease family)